MAVGTAKRVNVGDTANLGIFVSAEQTGTGAEQTISHTLDRVPQVVLVIPTDLNVATTGAFTVAEGTHTSAAVLVNVTLSKKYRVVAF